MVSTNQSILYTTLPIFLLFIRITMEKVNIIFLSSLLSEISDQL